MIVAVVKGVRSHFVTRLPEWINTWIILYYSITLLRPGETFKQSNAYTVMASIADENTWGRWFLALALARFSVLFINGTFRPFRPWSPTFRALLAFINAMVWFVIATDLFISNSLLPSAGTYMGLMALDLIIARNVAGEAGTAFRGRHV